MKEKRIYQISKELNISHHEIIKFVENNGFKVSNHMMPVSNEIYSLILTEFSKEKRQVERVQKEKARQAIVTNNQTKQSAVLEKPKIETKIEKPKLDLKESIRQSKEKLNSQAVKDDAVEETNFKKVDISKITDNKNTKSRGPAISWGYSPHLFNFERSAKYETRK